MTILGRGDLSPPRRHRRSRWPRALGLLLVVAALGAGGYAAYRHFDKPARAAVDTARTCPAPRPGATPAAASAVRLQIRNGTGRTGLAHALKRSLVRRGFRVGAVGNRAKLRGPSLVRYPPGHRSQALAVREQVPGARLVEARSLRVVELDIGTRFHGLASRAQATAAHARDATAARPKPTPCPAGRGR